MESPPNISYAICTYGDSISLVMDCLKSIYSDVEGSVNVMVIHEAENHLFEEMRTSLLSFDQEVNLIRQENGTGLSNGRNLALDNCDTDWIAFLDDDATMIQGWHRELMEGVEEFTNAAGFTGPILPEYLEGSKPYPKPMEWLVSCNTRKIEKGPVRNGFGANMVFNCEKISKHEIYFWEEYGSKKAGSEKAIWKAISAEETIFSSELSSASGADIIWLPKLSVFHKVPKSRTSPSYIWRRSFKEGKTKALLRKSDLNLSMDKEKGHLFRIFLVDLPLEFIKLPLMPIASSRNILGIFLMLSGTLSGFFLHSLIPRVK